MSINATFLTLLFVIFQIDGLLSANTTIWGPGLNPEIVLPARYFYVEYNPDKYVINSYGTFFILLII